MAGRQRLLALAVEPDVGQQLGVDRAAVVHGEFRRGTAAQQQGGSSQQGGMPGDGADV
jgi:hypothetical protein